MSAKKKAPKRAKRKAAPKKQALAKARETYVMPSRDIADDEEIVRHMSTEDLMHSPQSRALAIIQASQQASAAQQLAYGAFLDLLDTDKIQIVREDDGSLWAFVQNDPSPDPLARRDSPPRRRRRGVVVLAERGQDRLGARVTDTCVAIKQEHPPTVRSFVSDLKALFGGTAPRCGEPATKQTPLGPLCDACYERIETGRKNRTNLLGILEEAQQRRK